ncbi:hypothetical protein GCM10011396_38410 [Undibacterium terreum]|uniref:Prepilin-type N-terminal cleavage/methylation domain-containing protein n=2 Tax=Undibacterium terreum TaxID=1224302 RepID=A0A916UUI3_9BURK|nr:type II secretion system protein [Undibacterium terreum]GGC87463.1 hypothetical protein GCM10011396_38410 [Undibacterium terreum]
MVFSRYRAAGFTILEMLVVIAMSGMIVMILLQALQNVMTLHHRFGVELDRNRQQAMAQSWVRQLVEGLQPDLEDGENKLQGSSKEIKGLSTSVVTEQFGMPTPFSLKMRYNLANNRTVIEYADQLHQDTPMELWSWEGSRGKFIFIDNKQREYETWPPELDHSRQIPASIRLEAERDGQPWILSFNPGGPVNPLPDLKKTYAGALN